MYNPGLVAQATPAVVAETNSFLIGCSIFLVGGLKRAAHCGLFVRAVAERLSKDIPADAPQSH